jgi:hypothetical protein
LLSKQKRENPPDAWQQTYANWEWGKENLRVEKRNNELLLVKTIYWHITLPQTHSQTP